MSNINIELSLENADRLFRILTDAVCVAESEGEMDADDFATATDFLAGLEFQITHEQQRRAARHRQ